MLIWHYANVLAADETFVTEGAAEDEALVHTIADQLTEAGIEYGTPYPLGPSAQARHRYAVRCPAVCYGGVEGARTIGMLVEPTGRAAGLIEPHSRQSAGQIFLTAFREVGLNARRNLGRPKGGEGRGELTAAVRSPPHQRSILTRGRSSPD